VIADVNISGLAARFYEPRYLAMPPMMTYLTRGAIQANAEMILLLYSPDFNLGLVGMIQKWEWRHDEFLKLFREIERRAAA
jgi:hypothetical protein